MTFRYGLFVDVAVNEDMINNQRWVLCDVDQKETTDHTAKWVDRHYVTGRSAPLV